jgi:hypothetical protein
MLPYLGDNSPDQPGQGFDRPRRNYFGKNVRINTSDGWWRPTPDGTTAWKAVAQWPGPLTILLTGGLAEISNYNEFLQFEPKPLGSEGFGSQSGPPGAAAAGMPAVASGLNPDYG